MNEELNKQLAELAAKLGTNAEHLWSVLVKQAYIDGISSLMTTLGCGVATAVVLWFFVYLRPKWKETVEHGIENAPAAFLKLFTGENLGKMLVKLA